MTYASDHDLSVGFLGEALAARGGGIATTMPARVQTLNRRGVTVEVFCLRDLTSGSEMLQYQKS